MADQYGLSVRNPNTGSIQIDQNYWNFELVEVGSVVTKNNVGLGDPTLGDTPYRSGFSGFTLKKPGLIFFPVGTYYVCEGSPSRRDVQARIFVTNAPVGTSITYYVFSNPVASSPVDRQYGLKVLDASGNVNFHSDRQYLNVTAIHLGTYTAASLPSLTLPAGRTYVVGSLKWAGRREIDFDRFFTPGGLSLYDIVERGLMFRIQSNTLQTMEGFYMDSEFADFNYIPTGSRFDVTENGFGFMVADITFFTNP